MSYQHPGNSRYVTAIQNVVLALLDSFKFNGVQSKTTRGCAPQNLEGRKLNRHNTPHNISFGQAKSD